MPQHVVTLPFTISSQALVTSGTTWAQFKAGGLKSVLDNLVAANSPLANPSVAATTASSAAASSLPIQNGYIVSYSWIDALGETLAGGASAAFNQVDAGHVLTATIPALPARAVGANLYLFNPATGITSVYATGITTTTFAMSYAAAVDMPGAQVPQVNNTGGTGSGNQEMLYAIITGYKTELMFEQFNELISNWVSRYPLEWREAVMRQNRLTGVFAYWYQCMLEIETLVFANVPTAAAATITPVGMPQYRWTLP